MKTRHSWRAAAVLAFGALLAPPLLAEDSPRQTMATVFEAMTRLIEIGATPEGFASEATRADAGAAFTRLGEAGSELLDHAEQRDADFFALSEGLLQDVEAARLAFELGRFEQARVRLHLITGRCVDCHSRLPDLEDSALADRWLERAGLENLAPTERAQLYVATRRFDDALQIWEELFVDPAQRPIDADQRGWLRDYLSVSIRVKRDLARPRIALLRLAERPDTPRYLEHRLRAWSDALESLGSGPVEAALPLTTPRDWIREGRGLERSPYGNDGLVHDLSASSLLLSWADAQATASTPPAPRQLAEAWYLLGLAESRIQSDAWFARMESYMEAAVRAAPGGPLAESAYELLEESLLISYGASHRAGLPRGERERLESLDDLVLQSTAPRGG